jgi:hypothetical protein
MSAPEELRSLLRTGLHETWSWFRLFAVGAAWGVPIACLLFLNPDSLPQGFASAAWNVLPWLVVVAPAASAWGAYAVTRADVRLESLSVASVFPLFFGIAALGVSILVGGPGGYFVLWSPIALALIGGVVTIASLWRWSRKAALWWAGVVAILVLAARLFSILPIGPDGEPGAMFPTMTVALLAVLAASFLAACVLFIKARAGSGAPSGLRQTEQALQPGAPKVSIES